MKSILIVLFSMSSFAWAEGGVVGNGGDIVTCRPSQENDLNGMYVLDYVATFDEQTNYIDESSSPIQAIWQNLLEKGKRNSNVDFANMAASLIRFYEAAQGQIFKNVDYKNFYVWLRQPYGLVDIKDEALVQLMPENCRTKKDSAISVNLIQAVIREERASSNIFRYDESILENLKAKSPLQLSFLIIHEWLRGRIKDTARLRDVVKLLHTQEFHDASPEDAKLMLERIAGGSNIAPPTSLISKKAKITDFNNVKPAVLTSPQGTFIRFEITYPTLNIFCAVHDYERPESGYYEGCGNIIHIHAGYSLWIKTLDNKYHKVIQVDAVDPEFDL